MGSVSQESDTGVILRSWTDPSAFAEIFNRHHAAVFRFLTARWGRDVGSDLASETFVVAFDRRHRFDLSKSSARPWLFGIALNLGKMEGRKMSREARAVERGDHRDEIEDFADSVVRKLDARKSAEAVGLSAAMAELRPENLSVLVLAVLGELSHLEISEVLDVPVGTVKSRLHRTLVVLRKRLDDRGTSQVTESGAPVGER